MRISPQREVTLTREQKEVDDFLRDYYSAYGNVSVSRLLMLFDDEAILSAPDGSIYSGTTEIRSYYSRVFMGYENFTTAREVVSIVVRGGDACATYYVRTRTWYFGATEAPQIFTKEIFSLRKVEGRWVINTLLIERVPAK
ncbi:nuclear transport factor 2 family protein [Candidatus Bathyarchaeota archaeon]|nr:nuclear transport factor 2 family protein [Candidatus Bathyarchaeota archaeon]